MAAVAAAAPAAVATVATAAQAAATPEAGAAVAAAAQVAVAAVAAATPAEEDNTQGEQGADGAEQGAETETAEQGAQHGGGAEQTGATGATAEEENSVGADLLRSERRRAGRVFHEDLRPSAPSLATMGPHSKWPEAVAIRRQTGALKAAATKQAKPSAVPVQAPAGAPGPVQPEPVQPVGLDQDGDEQGSRTTAAQRLRKVATGSTNRFETLSDEHAEDLADVGVELEEKEDARQEQETKAAQAKQSAQQPRKRRVTRLMMHKLAGHIGGLAGIRHVRALDPTLEIEEVAADRSEPTCGACAFAKMKRAPVGSGPHTPWGDKPGDGVALDWVEKTTSRRGNNCALLFTDTISGYIMPTFHVSKSSAAAVAGLKEWTAATYKTSAPPGVWILLDRDSTFLGDRLQPTSNTVFYNYVTEELGWRPHFAAGDEHATHGIAESTVQKVANTTAALLHDCRLGPYFWDDAMAHACHMLNVMPRSHKPAPAAVESQAGQRPRADRADPPALARFGCLVAFRIPSAERVGDKAKTIFGRKAELGAFLGWARDATFGSARVLSLSTGRVRVVRSMAFWDAIMPEARFTPSYLKELENQMRKLGDSAYVEHEAVEPASPEASPALTKEVVDNKEVLSAASKEVPTAGTSILPIKEVIKSGSKTSGSGSGKRWDSDARGVDELLRTPEVRQPSQIELVMAAVQRATHEDVIRELVMAALDEDTTLRPPSGHVYDDPMRPAATPKHMKDLARMSAADQRLWRAALKEELGGLHANKALVELGFADIPKGQRAMSCIVLFQKKDPDEEGRVRCKVRVVVRGCEQAREESDNRWNAPTVATALLKMVAIKAVSEGKQVLAADIKQAFLKSEIDTDVEQIYIKLVDEEGQMRYYMLAKGLYGLRSSPGRWFARFSADLRAYGLRSFPYNPCLWTDGITTLAVHVDDSMIVSTGPGCEDLVRYLRRCYGPDSVNVKPMSDVDTHLLVDDREAEVPERRARARELDATLLRH